MYGQTGAGKTYTMLGDYSSEIGKGNSNNHNTSTHGGNKDRSKTPKRGNNASSRNGRGQTSLSNYVDGRVNESIGSIGGASSNGGKSLNRGKTSKQNSSIAYHQ